MCGRYTLTMTLGELAERFHCQVPELPYRPRYNVAPTQEVWSSRVPVSQETPG